MLTRDAWPWLPALLILTISGCGSKGDLILPKGATAGAPPPARTRQQQSTTVVPIQPAIPSPPSIPPETAPPEEPKQP